MQFIATKKSDPESVAITVLANFFSEMKMWEKDRTSLGRRIDTGEIKSEEAFRLEEDRLLKVLKSLFIRYCTQGASARRFAEPQSFTEDGLQFDAKRYEMVDSNLKCNTR